jgi:DNA segregation ATPase FtsK/SpoIIIE, S-DNA-T family
MLMSKEFPLGIDELNNVVKINLNDVPHLLIGGSTGSGKSNFLHSTITHLVTHNSPESLKMILVDTKLVELSLYEKIPHLMEPVVNYANDFSSTLTRLISEIDRRMLNFKKEKVRNLDEYNKKSDIKIPNVIVIVDELADLFSRDERCIDKMMRVINISRAAGIHMILSTQRPSSDSIPGVIKANIPGRIAFKTASEVDSRIIIGPSHWSASTLNVGEAIYCCSGKDNITWVKTKFVSIDEINSVVNSLIKSKEKIELTIEDIIPESLDKENIGENGYFVITEADHRMCVLAINEFYPGELVPKSGIVGMLCSVVKTNMMIDVMIKDGFLKRSAVKDLYEWNKSVGSSILGINL